MQKQCYSSTVSRQQLCECFSFFFLMRKAMIYEVRPARLKKNTSRPNRCTTCGPFVNLFAMGTFLMLAKLICRCVLTYVRLGVCTVGTATDFSFLQWSSNVGSVPVQALTLSLFTGGVCEYEKPQTLNVLHIVCLLSQLTSWMRTYISIMTLFLNVLADRSRSDNFNSSVVQKHRKVGPSIGFPLCKSWHEGLRQNRSQSLPKSLLYVKGLPSGPRNVCLVYSPVWTCKCFSTGASLVQGCGCVYSCLL